MSPKLPLLEKEAREALAEMLGRPQHGLILTKMYGHDDMSGAIYARWEQEDDASGLSEFPLKLRVELIKGRVEVSTPAWSMPAGRALTLAARLLMLCGTADAVSKLAEGILKAGEADSPSTP